MEEDEEKRKLPTPVKYIRKGLLDYLIKTIIL